MAHARQLFNAQYIDPRGLFFYFFQKVPNISYVTDIDVVSAYPFIRDKVSIYIDEVYQHAQLNSDTGVLEFNVTYIVLQSSVLIEIGGDYVSVLHGRRETDLAATLLRDLTRFRIQKAGNSKIGFATQTELN